MRQSKNSSHITPNFLFRKPRLLVVGCGDVGRRVVRQLAGRVRVVVLTSSAEKRANLRALGGSAGAEAGVRVLVGDLDAPASLRRLAGLADRVLHAAPPARIALDSQRHRTKHVLDALARGGLRGLRNGLEWIPAYVGMTGRGRVVGSQLRRKHAFGGSFGGSRNGLEWFPAFACPERSRRAGMTGRITRLAYISTTGVYGNCDGGWVDETSTVQAETERAGRRVQAEGALRRYGTRGGYGLKASRFKSCILRAPGIYAADRAHGTPKARLAQGVPVLRAEEDVFTNRIHADDLARACVLALFRGRAQRVYNVCDGVEIKAGDYLEQAAALYGLPAPERVSKAEMAQRVSPMRMSFLNESRRIRNQRLQELGLQLRYPHPLDEVRALVASEQKGTL